MTLLSKTFQKLLFITGFLKTSLEACFFNRNFITQFFCFHKLTREQNHRVPGTCSVNHAHVTKCIKMTSNSKHGADRKHKNTGRRNTTFSKEHI